MEPPTPRDGSPLADARDQRLDEGTLLVPRRGLYELAKQTPGGLLLVLRRRIENTGPPRPLTARLGNGPGCRSSTRPLPPIGELQGLQGP